MKWFPFKSKSCLQFWLLITVNYLKKNSFGSWKVEFLSDNDLFSFIKIFFGKLIDKRNVRTAKCVDVVGNLLALHMLLFNVNSVVLWMNRGTHWLFGIMTRARMLMRFIDMVSMIIKVNIEAFLRLIFITCSNVLNDLVTQNHVHI